MVSRSKLKLALSAEKGVDLKKVKEKRRHKAALKQKRNTADQGKHGAEVEEEEWEEVDDDDENDGDEDAGEGGHGVTLLGGAGALDDDDDNDEEEESEDEVSGGVDLSMLDDSETSESEVDMEEKIPRVPKPLPTASRSKDTPASRKARKTAAAEKSGDDAVEIEQEDEDEEDIAMSDLEDLADEDREDLIPHSRLTINNTVALAAALNRIRIPTDSSVPFATHQCVISSAPTVDSIPDISDDLQRELAFYAQALEAVKKGRQLLKKEGVPFSRPNDYFAEMVKDDGHMEKVKAKLVEEATAKKAAADARKQRDLKKFGKQVQVAKLQERQKAKRETLEKIKVLKRKRQESSGDLPATEADLFDVAVDKELSSHANRGRKASSGREGPASGGAPGAKRQRKDERFGFGGKKRHAKSGDAVSAGDLSGFSARRMKTGGPGGPGGPGGAKGGRGKAGGKTPRLGKSRRKAMGAKR